MLKTAAAPLLLAALIFSALAAADVRRYDPGRDSSSRSSTNAVTAWLKYWTRIRAVSDSLEGVSQRPGSARTGPCDQALNNTSWFDGCNTCLCQNGILAICTLKYCPENYHTSLGCPAGMNPGDTWFFHCNKFTCSSPLTGVLMTIRTLKGHCWDTPKQAEARLNLARPQARKAVVGAAALTSAAGPCAKSEFWFDGCNRCRCLKGEPVICTRMACYDNELVMAGCPAGREAGDTWYADCNRHACQTLYGGPLVTRSTIKGHCW